MIWVRILCCVLQWCALVRCVLRLLQTRSRVLRNNRLLKDNLLGVDRQEVRAKHVAVVIVVGIPVVGKIVSRVQNKCKHLRVLLVPPILLRPLRRCVLARVPA